MATNSYTKQTWEDAPSTNSPVSAERLNHMETGIKNNNTGVRTLETAVGNTASLATTSKEVVGAINEIKSDLTKGSVSVTANGVKTFKTLLEELYALVDLTKVDHKSVFSIGQFKAPLVRVQPNALWFTSCIITDQFAISTYIVAGTSHTYSCIGTTPTFKSDDSYVWPNGTKLELFY